VYYITTCDRETTKEKRTIFILVCLFLQEQEVVCEWGKILYIVLVRLGPSWSTSSSWSVVNGQRSAVNGQQQEGKDAGTEQRLQSGRLWSGRCWKVVSRPPIRQGNLPRILHPHCRGHLSSSKSLSSPLYFSLYFYLQLQLQLQYISHCTALCSVQCTIHSQINLCIIDGMTAIVM